MANAFYEIKTTNNWGHVGYSARDVDSGRSIEPAIKGGQRYVVRWPNGSVESVLVIGKEHSEDVMDMGHNYHAESTLFGFFAYLNGVTLWIPIEKVEVQF